MIIVATPQATIPAVDLLVDAMPAGTATVQVWRSYAGDRSVVRDADGALTGGATSRPYTDYEVPLSIATSYQVYAYSSAGAVLGSAQSAPVTVASASPWISDPLAPGRGCAVSLINESLQELAREARGEVVQVVDGLPIAVFGEMGEASSVPLKFKAEDAAQGQRIREVLQSADPFLLRVPPQGNHQIPPLAYIGFTGYSDNKVKRGTDRDQITITGGVVVAPPVSPVVLAIRTCGDLRDEASTCGDVTAMYDTCLAVLRGY